MEKIHKFEYSIHVSRIDSRAQNLSTAKPEQKIPESNKL